jgi:hypothetical protein
MNLGGSRVPIAVLGVATGFLVLAWWDAHYWDEFFYLYSVFAHSPTELVRYELVTGLFPVGFFSEKLGHVVLLDLLTDGLGPGVRSLYLIQALYTLLLIGFFAAAYGLLRDLLGARQARDATLVLVFSPLAVYLAFKAMSEVPSLLFTTLGSWAFVRCFTDGAGRRKSLWLVLATIALTVGVLCRFTMVLSFTGLGIALLVAGDERFSRRQLVTRLLATGIAVAALHAAGLALAGGSALRFAQHVHNVVTEHPPFQRVWALGLFLQSLVLALPFAWTGRGGVRPAFAAVWLAASALPFLVGHEPRYYAPALVPLAVVSAVGLQSAAERLCLTRWRHGWIGLLAATVLVNRVLLIPLMPYEVEEGRLLALVGELQGSAPGATYLVPWSTDYSLLRFALPEANIALCLTATPGSRLAMAGQTGPLSSADQWWAGKDRYVGSRSELDRRPRPWIYIGWELNPAALRLKALLEVAGLERLLLSGPSLHNHLAGSWIWYDRSLQLVPREHRGRYYVYEVIPLGAAPAERDTTGGRAVPSR